MLQFRKNLIFEQQENAPWKTNFVRLIRRSDDEKIFPVRDFVTTTFLLPENYSQSMGTQQINCDE